MIVRHVLGHEAQRLREIRLRALATDPAAYGSTYAEEVDRPDAWWERGATLSEAGDEQRHFVLADDEDAWFGLALVREDDESPGRDRQRALRRTLA
jgi:hypothetical protein